MATVAPRLISGRARVGARTKELVRRLEPGEIAVIDHRNIDRVAAEELLAASPAAVVNASPSADGTYPNLGPLILVRGGVPLIDSDAGVLDRVADGETIEVDGGEALEIEDLLARLDQGRARAAEAPASPSPRTRSTTSARRRMDFSRSPICPRRERAFGAATR